MILSFCRECHHFMVNLKLAKKYWIVYYIYSAEFILSLKTSPSYGTEGREKKGASRDSRGFPCPLSGRFQLSLEIKSQL